MPLNDWDRTFGTAGKWLSLVSVAKGRTTAKSAKHAKLRKDFSLVFFCEPFASFAVEIAFRNKS